MSDRAFIRIAAVAIGSMATVVSACSSDSSRLPDEMVASTSSIVTSLGSGAGVELGVPDAECVARRLDADQAEQLRALVETDDALPIDLADLLSRSILACVDSTVLARSALEPLANGAGADSLDCAADRVGVELITSLVSASLRGDEVPAAQVESQVAIAFALCFTPAELLNRG